MEFVFDQKNPQMYNGTELWMVVAIRIAQIKLLKAGKLCYHYKLLFSITLNFELTISKQTCYSKMIDIHWR